MRSQALKELRSLELGTMGPRPTSSEGPPVFGRGADEGSEAGLQGDEPQRTDSYSEAIKSQREAERAREDGDAPHQQAPRAHS